MPYLHLPLLASSVYIHLMQAMDDGNYAILTIFHCLFYIYTWCKQWTMNYGIVTSSIACIKCIYTLDASMDVVTMAYLPSSIACIIVYTLDASSGRW